MLLRRIIDLYNSSAHSTVFYAPVGSMNGLALLKKGAATASPVHILDTQSKDYNLSYLNRYLGDGPFRGHPSFPEGTGNLPAERQPERDQNTRGSFRKTVTFVNRNRGSGTRFSSIPPSQPPDRPGCDQGLRVCGGLPSGGGVTGVNRQG